MKTRRLRTAVALVIAAVLALTIAACGSDSSSSASSSDDTAAGGDSGDGMMDVKVTSIGYCNEVYLWWAQEKGIFTDNDLNVELVPAQGGAAGVAAIMSGAADFSFTNGYTALISLSQGFPLKFVSLAYESPAPGSPEVNSLIVRNDSGISSPQDLVGKRIGVNELGGINQIVTTVWLENEGVDPTQVSFVALPFNQLVPAVVGGQIDAAQASTSSITSDAANELTSLGDPYQEGPGVVEFAGYLTTDDFYSENPAAVEAFQASLDESISQINDPANVQEAYELAATNCNQDADVLASQAQNPYIATIDMDVLDEMAQTLVDQGILREKPDISEFVPEFAQRQS